MSCVKLPRYTFKRNSSNFVSSCECTQSTRLIPFRATSYGEIHARFVATMRIVQVGKMDCNEDSFLVRYHVPVAIMICSFSVFFNLIYTLFVTAV